MRRCPHMYEINAYLFLRRMSKKYGQNLTRATIPDEEWQKLASPGAGVDFKSRLQELTHSRFQQTPVYYLVAEVGPDHDKRFTVEVKVNDEILGRGSGKSKKIAEMEAARLALEQLGADFTE